MEITAFDLAQRYIGIKEISGAANHPLVSWWLSLCGFSLDTPDEVPWCSAFINGIAWELRLPRSKSAAARSWLTVGTVPETPIVGFDVVILSRGDNPAQGHVGFFGGYEPAGVPTSVRVLGGNQGNAVSVEAFPVERIVGIRRLI